MDKPADSQDCPVTACLAVLGGKWKPVLLFLVSRGCNRFGALTRALPAISKQMLTRQLRELELDGILDRHIFAQVPPRVEYTLTERGHGLMPVIHAMRDWGLANPRLRTTTIDSEE